MKINSLISKLHPLERKVLPALKNNKELSSIITASGLQEIEVMRALQWLENKSILHISTDVQKVVVLDKNGVKYQQEGLPERRFLKALTLEFQPLSAVAQKAKLQREELDACIGILKHKVAVEIRKEKELMVKLGPQGLKILKNGTPEEHFITKDFPLELDKVKDIGRFALDELKKRKGFIRIEDQKTVTILLTELGQKIVNSKISGEAVNRLTSEMLKTGSWRNKQFRAYDIGVKVPAIHGGKKHFVNQSIEYAKQIWIEMGFKEMTGTIVNTSFWNFDALFTAQDHPVRELQDTYYLGGRVEKGKL
ncbi:hypothetical protein HZC32_03485, partial [Candidatus Woesearchaeota archaeon]|nr:hypothetical protein [Candidatus Woesearchaeota archaeon]